MRWIAAIALVGTAAFFLEYLPPFQKVHLFSDIELYHYPLQRYAFQALKEGRLPQWDSSMYCGIPFAANLQAALFYPPSWLLYAVNWRNAQLSFFSLECFAFAHVWLAFVLCYLWLRARRLRAFACALGAAGFACGGYMMWQIVHLGVAFALPWMPLAFWGIDEAAEKRRWHPLWKTSLASAMWFLAGYPPSWVAFCGTVMVYALASRGRWRLAAQTAAALAASFLLAAVQALPALEAQSLMFKEPRYFGDLRASIPSLFVANWYDYNRSSSVHYLAARYLYWGLPALFAVAWAIRRRRFGPYAQAVAVMAFCLYFVGDPGNHIHEAIRWNMTLLGTLQQYNFFEGVTAMVALIAATGVSDFLDSRASRPAPGWLVAVAMVASVGFAARQATVWARGGNFPDGPIAAAWTAVGLGVLALALWTMRATQGRARAAAGAAALLFVLCDYKVFGTNRMFNTRDGEVDPLYPEHGIRGFNQVSVDALSANRQYRLTSDGAPSSMEFRMWKLASPQGLDPMLTRQYRQFIQPWATFENSRVFLVNYANTGMMQRLGVRYAITHKGGPNAEVLAGSPLFRLVGPDNSFYRVYEYLDARPSFAWEGDGGARPTGWIPERREFHVQSSNGGRFGLAEQLFPGWRATVDGRPAEIEVWNGVFQSIQVARGEHVVVFEYRSWVLVWGAAISLGTLAGLFWVLYLGRRDRDSFAMEST